MTSTEAAPRREGTLRVLTWALRGPGGGARVRRVVGVTRPDVVCLLGAPRGPRWRSRSARLARRCGLLYVAGGGDAAGCLLLARLGVPVLDRVAVRLAPSRVVPARAGAAVALVTIAGRPCVIAGCRLGRGEGDVASLRAAVGRWVAPVLLAGELSGLWTVGTPPVVGRVRAGAGRVDVVVPAGGGLRVEATEALGAVRG